MKLFSLVIIAVFLISCSDENKHSVVTDKFKSQVPDRPGINYFPADSLFFSSVSKSPSLDSFVRQLYSEVLYNLREPVLYNYSGGQSIRFVWLRPFGNPVVVRLNNFNDTVYVNIKSLKIKSSEDEVTIIALDATNWQKSLSMLEANNFWNAITQADLSNTSKDAILWFLECRVPDKYHCINRSDNGDFASKDLNLFAKDLLEISKRYVRMKNIR